MFSKPRSCTFRSPCMSSTSREEKTLDVEVFRHIQNRQYGGKHLYLNQEKLMLPFVSQHVPPLLAEKEYEMGKINKIFASHWLDDRQVAIGTKCNKLIIMDTKTGKQFNIPSLKSSKNSIPAECPCGIHSIALNPSQTLCATGAENTNDLAVYQLPTFDPVMVGENGHCDWIFDITWIDDEYLVTGSRDSKLALWRVETADTDSDDNEPSSSTGIHMPDYAITKPVISRLCEKAQKVRALAYHDERKELAVLSLNGCFHLWDVENFNARIHRCLIHSRENVCMAVSKKYCSYAVGSQSHIDILDPRCPNTQTSILSKYRGSGVRSLSFTDDVLTIGTGVGVVLFFDVRAGRYLESDCGHACSLMAGSGWLRHDETYRDFFWEAEYPSAIYTHRYNSTGTHLFTAGGPLPAGLWGNYAGLWQ
ncbi:DDB1- and CUL4-associated factor 12-like isoform X2 [Saccostrea echinata]|uniref:DDB1- and CUL4-associated factor 12-like isoform X2 n=1 Tax=Saccostrea echinata TaxID=191078 RepID=UPI002A80A914|nr:DDB1- and CUL4-associated factor 12-like isoform X2 [Saccostrea echinata]